MWRVEYVTVEADGRRMIYSSDLPDRVSAHSLLDLLRLLTVCIAARAFPLDTASAAAA